MGAKAERRCKAVAIVIGSDAARPTEFERMDSLNTLEKYPGAGTPYKPIKFAWDECHKAWWALDQEKGWNGYGYPYKTLRDAVRRWDVDIVGYKDGEWLARTRRGI